MNVRVATLRPGFLLHGDRVKNPFNLKSRALRPIHLECHVQFVFQADTGSLEPQMKRTNLMLSYATVPWANLRV
jgi:ABC-type dipeptide/oligopeptide/nickel transport system ATPase subunit